MRDAIQEDIPGLVGACRESRDLAPPSYCTLFDYNNPSWVVAGALNINRLREIMSTLDLPDIPSPRPTFYPSILRSAILTHMNKHRTDRSQESLFSTFGMKNMPIGPRWFNPDHDVMLLKPLLTPRPYTTWEFGLWNHTNPEAQKMKHLAFELNTLNFEEKDKIYLWQSDAFPMRAPKDHLDAVESVTFLCMDTYEVIIATLDHQLEYDKWSYSLNVESRAFKDQMGDRWTNVTWNVKLSPPPAETRYRHDLWEALLS
jgi:hypothetical protein